MGNVDNSENETTGKKTRAKRPVYFYGIPAGVKVECIKMPGENWNQKDAETQLRKRLGEDCQIIGPDFRVQGVKVVSNSPTVKVDLRDLAYTSDQFTGDHGGWTFVANGLKGCEGDDGVTYSDNELVHIQFEARLDPTSKVSKPRFGRSPIVKADSLDNIIAV